jgi:hypothetical protein
LGPYFRVHAPLRTAQRQDAAFLSPQVDFMITLFSIISVTGSLYSECHSLLLRAFGYPMTQTPKCDSILVVCDKAACCDQTGPFAESCSARDCSSVMCESSPPPSTSPTTPPYNGNCDVNRNNCPSGQECVPLPTAYPYDWSSAPRGSCKAIDYSCRIWQVCRIGLLTSQRNQARCMHIA